MITKTIKICGKDVTVGYCNATEIAYNILAEESINTFMAEAATALEEKRMPDTRKTIFFIVAAVIAYSDWKGEEAKVTDRELMYEADPMDMGVALGTIISLRANFYHIPTGDQEEDTNEETAEEPKNA